MVLVAVVAVSQRWHLVVIYLLFGYWPVVASWPVGWQLVVGCVAQLVVGQLAVVICGGWCPVG